MYGKSHKNIRMADEIIFSFFLKTVIKKRVVIIILIVGGLIKMVIKICTGIPIFASTLLIIIMIRLFMT